MANDITTTDPAAFSAQSLTPNVRAILDRAFDADATFTADEAALVVPVAQAVATVIVSDARTIRQSIGTLDVALPSRDAGEIGSKLRLNAYLTMLAGCDERALAYACRRCLDELDWFPTIRQLKERIRGWVSPEAAAISRARAVMRAPRTPDTGAREPDLSEAEIHRVNAFLRSRGMGTRFAADGSTFQEVEAETAADNEPRERAAA